MTLLAFDFTLSQSDVARTLEFYERLRLAGIKFFSSDDFRDFGLDRCYVDKQHEIGTLFARLKANGYVVPRGERPSDRESNHKRRVDLFEFTPRFYLWLEELKR